MESSDRPLNQFLQARSVPVETHCDHPPVILGFRVSGPGGTEFTVALAGKQAYLERSGRQRVDHWINCTVEELEGLITGKSELLGRFWEDHLPFEWEWAPALYAFFFPGHPYAELSPVLEELYTTSRYYPTVTPFTQGYLLHSLVVEHKLARTLEIGLAFGGSAMFFCTAHERTRVGHHFAIDPFQGSLYRFEGLRLVKKAQLAAFMTWLPSMAQSALPALKRAGFELDLIYVDGDHALPAVLSDLLQAHSLLRTGGFLAFDDSHAPSGKRLLPLVTQRLPYEATSVSTDRLTVFRKTTDASAPALLRGAAVTGRIALEALKRRRIADWHARRSSLQ